ncbi:hypothetical protein SEA_SCOUPSA_33 [Microbacterium phage SCoupsA]|nr:hypothetical protein SEA_SCOUPSA_33 [Microbacterium phage SCoupsA]
MDEENIEWTCLECGATGIASSEELFGFNGGIHNCIKGGPFSNVARIQLAFKD